MAEAAGWPSEGAQGINLNASAKLLVFTPATLLLFLLLVSYMGFCSSSHTGLPPVLGEEAGLALLLH